MLHKIDTFVGIQVGTQIWGQSSNLNTLYTVITVDEKHPGYIYVTDMCEEPKRLYKTEKSYGDYYTFDSLGDVYQGIAEFCEHKAKFWHEQAEKFKAEKEKLDKEQGK